MNESLEDGPAAVYRASRKWVEGLRIEESPAVSWGLQHNPPHIDHLAFFPAGLQDSWPKAGRAITEPDNRLRLAGLCLGYLQEAFNDVWHHGYNAGLFGAHSNPAPSDVKNATRDLWEGLLKVSQGVGVLRAAADRPGASKEYLDDVQGLARRLRISWYREMGLPWPAKGEFPWSDAEDVHHLLHRIMLRLDDWEAGGAVTVRPADKGGEPPWRAKAQKRFFRDIAQICKDTGVDPGPKVAADHQEPTPFHLMVAAAWGHMAGLVDHEFSRPDHIPEECNPVARQAKLQNLVEERLRWAALDKPPRSGTIKKAAVALE